jgi:hypothetical protein
MSFYIYMAVPPKDRDNFFYGRGFRPPEICGKNGTGAAARRYLRVQIPF